MLVNHTSKKNFKQSEKSTATQTINCDPLSKVPISRARGPLNTHFLRDLCVAMQDAPVHQSSSPASLPMAEQTKLFVQIRSLLPAATSERAALREASGPLGLEAPEGHQIVDPVPVIENLDQHAPDH